MRAKCQQVLLSCVASMCLLTCVQHATPAQAHTAALPELELRPITSTPRELLSNDNVPGDMILGELNQLYGKQALQVVFSRPIIALGSDFGDVDAYAQAPFTLSCNKEEKASFRFRWVTTSIARIDPVNMWPKCDLRCTFSFKQNFTSYDGVLLNLNGIPANQKLENYCPPKKPLIYKASPKGHLQKVITKWPMYPPTYPSIGNEMEWYLPRRKIRSNAYEMQSSSWTSTLKLPRTY
ncbi:hypothetical protein DUNSADRAFT_18596 [Dunaliella salina]|uniref:Uncharacterized protein n=1 Tax=Dunaliella salina TaxID=3046 RepID=A0ABQ7FZV7_DUNSA|nr:hypothetical protein DUNSADRAFT_18596 [Dunaliella salina]|eukprot:KAF5827878.1 hypothetical protein DUNSADRAFT_18596 [Dunaliella salina]